MVYCTFTCTHTHPRFQEVNHILLAGGKPFCPKCDVQLGYVVSQNRAWETGKLADYPNMLVLQEGTLHVPWLPSQMLAVRRLRVGVYVPISASTACCQEKNKLLRQWIACGQNMEACESRIKMRKQQSLEGKKIWEQVAVKDMTKPPYNFSARLV